MSKQKAIEEIQKEDEEFLSMFGDVLPEEQKQEEKKKEEFISKFPPEYIFTKEQVEKQANKIANFLKLIKPHLQGDYYTEGATELRPRKRDKEDKKYIRSFNTFHLLDKDVQELTTFLENINGHGYCLYYSIFDFDRTIDTENNKYKYTIKKENALYTTILPMDLDNCSEAKYKEIKGVLNGLGIETVDIFSGHGYQIVILLDSKIYDKEILKKFTTLLISKGIPADGAIIDAARIMRLPYTFNCKCYDPKYEQYQGAGPVPVKLISSTQSRYNHIDIFRKLNTLPDVIERTDEEETNEIALNSIKTKPLTEDVVKPKVDIKEVKNIEITSLKTLYPMLNFEALPLAIQKMLAGSQQGLRNKVILFIIPFFRNTLGLDLATIKEIMVIWGSRCNPVLNKEFMLKEVDRIYSYGLKSPSGSITDELVKAYGRIELDTYTRENKVKIPNEFFEQFNALSDGAIKIYLVMQLNKHLDKANDKEYKQRLTKQEIMDLVNISDRTFKRNIKYLIDVKLVNKTRGNRRKKEEYVYYINPKFSSISGFTLLETAIIKLMMYELTDGEMALYSYLAYMVGNTKGTCWASQSYLGQKVGKTQQGIAKMTNGMHNKQFITKTTIGTGIISHSTYNLNY